MATEKFHFDSSAGAIAVPKFDQIPVGVIRSVRKKSQAEQIFSTLEAVADEKTLAVLDKLSTREFNEFVGAWQKDAGISVGESSAS